MHEAALLRAAQPAPAVVLGLLLRPLSIGHMLQLHGGNVLESESMTVEELTVGAMICARSWDESLRVASDRLLDFKLRIWKWRVIRQSKKLANYFPTETVKFVEYLTAGTYDFPISDAPRPGRSGASRQPGCPFVLRLHQWIMTRFNLTESAAWDYPFSLAKMRWACHWEMEGGLDIRNPQDESFDKFIAENDHE